MVTEKNAQEQNGDCFTSTTTPTTNQTLCNAIMGAKFVVPIIFIPGIMGSNIMSNDGQKVWFPPNGKAAGAWAAFNGGVFRTATKRQTQLNPETTRVSNEGDINLKKNEIARFSEDDARARGWGTVWWDGYGEGLVFLERFLNHELTKLNLNFLGIQNTDEFTGSDPWRMFCKVNGADELKKNILKNLWNPTKDFDFLENKDFEKLADYNFPVFALGYNWLQCNSVSSADIADRLNTFVKPRVAKEFPKATFKKFIILTHSMGGLVARSLILDENASKDILGVIHGVMPASGAPTVYKRFANGWDGSEVTGSAMDDAAKYVFGASSEKLVPVLGNAPGGLELLPFPNFLTTMESSLTTKVKPWLKLIARNMDGEIITATLPKEDPYEEIYFRTRNWWQMVNLDYLDPNGSIRGINTDTGVRPVGSGSIIGIGGSSGMGTFNGMGSLSRMNTQQDDEKPNKSDLEAALEDKLLKTLGVVQVFHTKIADSYHDNTFAHYGNDPAHLAFSEVVWETEQRLDIKTEDDLIDYTGMKASKEKGAYNAKEDVFEMSTIEVYPWSKKLFAKDGERRISRRNQEDVVFRLHVAPNPRTGAGDGTVCHQSAEDVNREKVKQTFVINGYDHANSYKNVNVLHSVLFSVANLMKSI